MEANSSLVISAAIGLGLGIAIGWVLRGRSAHSFGKGIRSSKEILEEVSDAIRLPMSGGDTGEMKMVLVVRNDLKMGKGKIAAQCAHAAVGAVERAKKLDPANLQQWRLYGQPKVVVKVEDEATLLELADKALAMGLVSCLISDAGRTQIAAGSKTVLGIGPGSASLINQITGHLKLM